MYAPICTGYTYIQVQLQEYPQRRLGDVRSGIKTTRFEKEGEEESALVAGGDPMTEPNLDNLTSKSTALKWKLFSEKARAASNEVSRCLGFVHTNQGSQYIVLPASFVSEPEPGS